MRRERDAVARLAIVAACAAAISCSALESFQGLEGSANLDGGARDASSNKAATLDATKDAPSAIDASDIDVTESADADDVDSAPQGTVLYSEDFESGCDTSYGAYQATLMSSSVAHTGNGSCEVCYASGKSFYTIDHGLPNPAPPVGSLIYAQAWVRAISSAPAAQSSALTLRTWADSEYDPLEENQGDSVTLSTTWQLVTTTLAPTKSSSFGWDYYVVASELVGGVNNGDCFLIDDVVITQVH